MQKVQLIDYTHTPEFGLCHSHNNFKICTNVFDEIYYINQNCYIRISNRWITLNMIKSYQMHDNFIDKQPVCQNAK